MKQRIVILGGGESGTGAAILAKTKGFDVFLSDKGIIKDKYKAGLAKYDIPWEEKQHTEQKILNAAEIIISPGIPDNVPLVGKAEEKNIPVISELEFAARFTNAVKICITGSNGKTTTANLAYHIFQKAGLNVCLAGNVGNSFAWQLAEKDFDYFILEISSFQLDNMFRFKAETAVLMNITPDHLDRYDYNFQKYTDSKFRIIQNQQPTDHFIYCADDEVIVKEMQKRKISAVKLPFSFERVAQGAFADSKSIYVKYNQNDFNMYLDELALQGKHNVYNSMATAIAGQIYNIRKEIIRESLMDFQGVEHRLEFVLKIHGIDFINDSKATNVNSTWYALESMEKPVIWIAGGIDKGNDYKILKELAKSKVKAIICIGTENSKLVKTFKRYVETITEAETMDEAVKAAYYLAKNDDCVLLSPACASFDRFENYEDRGWQFKNAVKNL